MKDIEIGHTLSVQLRDGGKWGGGCRVEGLWFTVNGAAQLSFLVQDGHSLSPPVRIVIRKKTLKP